MRILLAARFPPPRGKMAKQELVLPVNAAMATDGICRTDGKLKKSDELLHSVDIGEKPEGTFQYQSEVAQSSAPHEERVVISGLLMNNVNPEERIVILGNLDNREIGEELGRGAGGCRNQQFSCEHIETIDDQELAPSDYIDTTAPTVWGFYTEAGP
uniref:Uncharacterized protein n=1 Tax=Amphimedon queenslandica TaxID=400682 RepID=A0A1X7UTQ3_AMPQE